MMTRAEGDRVTAADGDGRGLVETPEVLDARLVPGAVCCWAATAVALVAGWRGGLGVAVGCLLIGFGVAALMVRRVRAGRPTMLAWVLLGALLIGAGFGLAGAWHAYRVETHPLRAVRAGQRLVAVVELNDDPKRVSGRPFGGPKVMVRAGLVEYRLGGQVVRAGGTVMVLAPAGGWKSLLPGQRVEFRARVARPWRPDLTVAVLRADAAPVAVGDPPWWQRVAGRVRGDFGASAHRALSDDAAGLLPGLVIGDTSALTEHVQENFRETDLTHLTAVSGANVTILLGAVLVSMRALTVDPRIGAIAAGVALVMFVILARPSPSVLRAAVMGAIALLALCTGRRKQALPALCGAIIGLLAWSPNLAVDAGFALSVLATAGLIVIAPGWADWLRAHGWWRIPADAFAVAAAAFVVTTPLVIAMTGHLSLVAIAVNMLVEPVIAPITILGAIGALLACLWSPLATLVLHCTAPPLWWLLTVSDRAAALGASVSLPTGTRSGLLAAIVCGLVIIALRPRALPPLPSPDADA
ncbi:ComEC/Rec2 family competence protein [Nocardia sp. CDC160]|uniref:ComEC/Rec2 family competence protein n=1 Tax=Nocardia sp. CDC160 TaxID=3112166 RepID=UPI002DB61DEE|nr:ComEC/Rec2 family competence protein [Nocardia sp. CDC160]MEC3915294.1 ComEC/Rec2 family competence protein [Nocardia sp. CDC160]